MEENDVLESVGQEEGTTTTETNEEIAEVQEEQKQEEKPITFTQNEVNEIVRNRLERERSSIYKKCNVNNKEELEQYFENVKDYDEVKTNYENAQNKSKELAKELAFIKNDIDFSKKEEIEKYFAEKDIEIDEKSLLEALKDHQNWKNNTVKIKEISAQRGRKEATDEKSEVAKLFGLREII